MEVSHEDPAYEQEEACPVFSDSDDIECSVHESEEGDLQVHPEMKDNEDAEEPEIDD